jgi:dTDP-4-amino-4,6-dideoxygalactose transaminase
LEKVDRIIDYYNDCLGISNPHGLERYTIQVENRDDCIRKLEAAGIECRTWFKTHANQWDCMTKFRTSLPVTDFLHSACFDVPLNEFLEDHEIEMVGSALSTIKESITSFEKQIHKS